MPAMRILIVEDDEDDFFIIRHMLFAGDRKKYQLDWVQTLDEGWEALSTGWYAAALVDYHLNSESGLELIQKAVAAGSRTALILLTAQGDSALDQAALQAGASLYLTKDEITPSLLDRTVRYAVERERLLAENRQQKNLLEASAIQLTKLFEDLQAQFKLLQTAQERLVQSEKLAAIGELVSGMAHELNNPLTAILMRAQLLQDTVEDPETRQDLKQVESEALRAAGIVQSLLDFARQRPMVCTPLKVSEPLEAALSLVNYSLTTHAIGCQKRIAAGLPLVCGDPQRLQQVFINLLNNAIQSILTGQGSGKIALSGELRLAGFTRLEAAGPVVRIEIQDNGAGIPTQLLRRIFDPFFTTKEVGQGTGLGLSVCHGIISEHGGDIWAESTPGRGATFFIELPVYTPGQAKAEFNQAQACKKKPVAEQTARVLLIETEPTVTEVLSRFLSWHGFLVEVASTGEEAFARIRSQNTPYNLILSDICMPGMSGIDFYQQVQLTHPGLVNQILFLTADAQNEITRSFLEKTRASYLEKPFEMEALLERIHGILC